MRISYRSKTNLLITIAAVTSGGVLCVPFFGAGTAVIAALLAGYFAFPGNSLRISSGHVVRRVANAFTRKVRIVDISNVTVVPIASVPRREQLRSKYLVDIGCPGFVSVQTFDGRSLLFCTSHPESAAELVRQKLRERSA